MSSLARAAWPVSPRAGRVRRVGLVITDSAEIITDSGVPAQLLDRAEPEVILIGTGSEVALCVAAYEALTEEGIPARVVSMPCWELFEKQDEAYRDEVLPPRVRARVAVEEAADFGWHRYVGIDGAILGMETFGASAPIQKVQAMFGFEPAHVIQAARDQLGRRP